MKTRYGLRTALMGVALGAGALGVAVAASEHVPAKPVVSDHSPATTTEVRGGSVEVTCPDITIQVAEGYITPPSPWFAWMPQSSSTITVKPTSATLWKGQPDDDNGHPLAGGYLICGGHLPSSVAGHLGAEVDIAKWPPPDHPHCTPWDTKAKFTCTR
jgi:hypothetical protein